jgi:hypothetical protein
MRGWDTCQVARKQSNSAELKFADGLSDPSVRTEVVMRYQGAARCQSRIKVVKRR